MQHLVTVFLILLIVGLTYLYRHWHGELSKTFSQTAATTRVSYWYYVGLFGVTLPILYLFFSSWFVPHLALPSGFIFLASLSLAAQFACTLFPDNGNWTSIEHRILTGISGVLLVPMLVIVGFSSLLSGGERVMIAVCITCMLWLLGIALKHQSGYPFALLLQIGYYLLFFLPILYLTYR